jgi:hypothetical protein
MAASGQAADKEKDLKSSDDESDGWPRTHLPFWHGFAVKRARRILVCG